MIITSLHLSPGNTGAEIPSSVGLMLNRSIVVTDEQRGPVEIALDDGDDRPAFSYKPLPGLNIDNLGGVDGYGRFKLSLGPRAYQRTFPMQVGVIGIRNQRLFLRVTDSDGCIDEITISSQVLSSQVNRIDWYAHWCLYRVSRTGQPISLFECPSPLPKPCAWSEKQPRATPEAGSNVIRLN